MRLTIEQALTKAIEFHKAEMFNDASNLYNNVLQMDPKHPIANHNKGDLISNKGDFKNSIFYFRNALKANPNEYQFWVSYINALISSNNIAEATKTCLKAKEFGVSGKSFEDLNSTLESIAKNKAIGEKSIKKGDPGIEKLKSIDDLLALEKNQIALNLTNELICKFPESLKLHNYLGIIYHKMKRYKDSLVHFNKVLTFQPNSPEIYINIGNTYSEMKNFDQALFYYNKSLKTFPKFAEAYNCIGFTYYKLGCFDQSFQNYTNAISINPYNIFYHNNLGKLLIEHGKKDQALKSYIKSYLLNPNFDQKMLLAEFYLKEKMDCENGLKFLEDALVDRPMDTRALAYKYIALRGLERFNEANQLVDFPNLVHVDNIQNYTNENINLFNLELLSVLKNHPRRVEENNIGWAIRGGTVIRKLFKNSDTTIRKFQTLLTRAIDNRINKLPQNVHHPFLIGKPKKYNIDCWVNLLGSGDYQTNHIHDQGWMSGVYYVDLPDLSLERKKNASWIEFNRSGYDLPHFGGDREVQVIKPELGMLILFPSYVWHGTIPYLGNSNRVSISFDIELI